MRAPSTERTLAEWIERYNRKVPEGFKRDEKFALFFRPDKGFCEIANAGKMVIIGQVCGDGRFWKKHAEEWARELGLKACGAYFVRNEVSAYQKLFGFKVVKTEEKDGFKRYHCKAADGRWGLMTECVIDGKRRAHYVTWEV